MSRYAEVRAELRAAPRLWVVTGAAGFIGSNIVETLLSLNQKVVGLDNFSTGLRANLPDVERAVGAEAWRNFKLVEGDILDRALCSEIFKGADFVLHQAALGSVPRSINDPWATHLNNVDGFLSVLINARDSGVKRLVYASSSSVYGDSAELPKKEERIGEPLSPYAATKRMNEIYAHVFTRAYGLKSIGLRYFNVFGPRQNPAGPYAAVVPKWIEARLKGQPCTIYGDGSTSRDFCYVANAVQANILAALAPEAALNQEFNIAVNDETNLGELYQAIEFELHGKNITPPVYADFRAGDVKHSRADITRAKTLLGYEPEVRVMEGLKRVVGWYKARVAAA